MATPRVDGSVSVVIPTHNRAELLGRALLSVQAQSRPAGEIIVVDDGSDDGTAELVRSAFPAVRYVRQEQRGVSAARNRGLEAATGQWIAFLDSDDEWRVEKLERQMAALALDPTYRICHTDEIWIRAGVRVNPRRKHAKRGGWIYRHCLPLCAMSPSSVVIHRSVLESVGRFDEEMQACEDYDLWLRICCRHPVLLVDEPLVVKHGGRADQLSALRGQDQFRIRALEKILASGVLGAADRQATLCTLAEKIDIYAGGARRRGREAEALRYLEKRRRWLPSEDTGLT